MCFHHICNHSSLNYLRIVKDVLKIMSELCISCNSPVEGVRHAVSCDVCDSWPACTQS